MTNDDLLYGLLRGLDESRAGLLNLDRHYSGTCTTMAFLAPEVAEQLRGRLNAVRLGWSRLVVNAVEERLDVQGFRLAAGEPADAELWRLWQANNLDEQSQQAHLEALVTGRSYVLAWAGRDPATPLITVESARQMFTTRDPATREVTAAVKRWHGSGVDRAVVYEPDRITHWTRQHAGADDGEVSLVGVSGWSVTEVIDNPLGVVPVVPLVNRPRLMLADGESELAEVIPLEDAASKLATDLMVSAEYSAAPRRWITGMDIGSQQGEADATAAKVSARWEHAPASKLWIAGEPDTRFGQFPEASLEAYVSGIRMLTQQVAAVAGLPPHYLGLSSENPASADAIRSSEAGLVSKARRRQRWFGGAWEDVIRLAVHVRDGSPTTALDALETVWRDPETRTVAQAADAAVKLVSAGIVPAQQARIDLGYSPVQQAAMADMPANQIA